MSALRRDVLVTACLGAVFITLGSLRTLFIKFSENESGHYDYVPVTVNICSEFLKLVICFGLAMKVIIGEFKSGKGVCCCSSRQDCMELMKWAVPGLLYFIDNLIAFYTMEYFQPALVVLLGNFYIITTSLLFRLILKRRFSRQQWTAIFILFMAIMLLSLQTDSSVISVDHHKSHHAITHSLTTNQTTCSYIITSTNINVSASSTIKPVQKTFTFNFHEGHVLILFQCLISSTANVYNEKIFKENNDESIYVQNSKLYFFGFLFNGATLFMHNGYRERILKCGLFFGHNYFSFGLVLITAFYGLTVALIFKFRDNMFHVLNTQVTTVLVISASIYYFGFKPRLEFFLAAPIVLAAIYLFNVSKIKESNDHFEDLRRPEVRFRDEDRPLVPVLDQNED